MGTSWPLWQSCWGILGGCRFSLSSTNLRFCPDLAIDALAGLASAVLQNKKKSLSRFRHAPACCNRATFSVSSINQASIAAQRSVSARRQIVRHMSVRRSQIAPGITNSFSGGSRSFNASIADVNVPNPPQRSACRSRRPWPAPRPCRTSALLLGQHSVEFRVRHVTAQQADGAV